MIDRLLDGGLIRIRGVYGIFSAMVRGDDLELTNLEGKFTLKAPSDGNYIVQVTCVGFKPFTQRITVSGEKNIAMGEVTMKPDAIMLKGATVTGHAAKVTLKADTFIYNASAYRTPEGSVVEELVKRLPGAEVGDDGSIKINGKEVKKILVDGKEFMTGDTKTAMKNLPTNIIDRIKAYDQQSDLARISGIDDGEEQTVLDFGIKPGMNRGFMTNNDLGVGTRHRYSGRTFNGLMKQDMTVMMMASANNVNDMGFGVGGGRFGMGRQGLTATKMVGVNMNYEKKDKLVLDGSVRWNHNDGDAFSKSNSESFFSSSLSQFTNSVNQNFTQRLSNLDLFLFSRSSSQSYQSSYQIHSLFYVFIDQAFVCFWQVSQVNGFFACQVHVHFIGKEGIGCYRYTLAS